MEEFEKGVDIPFLFNFALGTTPETYMDIDALNEFEIWLYTSKNDIKKYKRVAESGFNELKKTDNYNYTAILTDEMTTGMKKGQIIIKLVWAQANAAYPDGLYNFEKTICTNAVLIDKP